MLSSTKHLKTGDKMSLIADRIRSISSDIRGENYQLSLELEKSGEEILKLNTGNPAAFGFGMPESVRKGVLQKLNMSVGYCDVRGMIPAREAIYNYHTSKFIKNFTLDDIFIGNGVSEIATMVSSALFESGDEVLLPMPCYSLWANEVILHNATPVFYRCDETNEWNPDIEHINSLITDKTKAILIINPNNPTGALYSDDILKEIVMIARKYHLIILSDEIYDRVIFDGHMHTSIASFAEDILVVTMNGLSKSHCLCGFRCGWMVISGPKEMRNHLSSAILKIASVRLSANAIMETIIPDAINDTEYTKNMISPGSRLYEQRKASFEELDKIEGISYVKNKAGLYVFPKLKNPKFENDKSFARDLLLKKHILIVPGSGFSMNTPDHFRIVMLPETAILRHAINEIGNYIDTM